MNINGRVKVKTLKAQFFEEFGLTIRVYDGRSFADDNATLASIRRGESIGGEFSPRKNTKVGNLEEKIQELFGLKTQIAGNDDSYLCDNDLTLAGAKEVDDKKMERKNMKKDKATPKKGSTRFEAKIKLASADSDFEIDELPIDFTQAKILWANKDPKCFDLLHNYIKCYFIKDNISGDVDELFSISEDDEMIEANELIITNVDFTDSNLPTFSATAHFDFKVKKGVTKEVIDEWEDENDMLDNAISFEWVIADLGEEEGLACRNHEGLGFNIEEDM